MTRQKEREMTFKFCLGKERQKGGRGEERRLCLLASIHVRLLHVRTSKKIEAKGGGEKSNHSIEAHYSEGWERGETSLIGCPFHFQSGLAGENREREKSHWASFWLLAPSRVFSPLPPLAAYAGRSVPQWQKNGFSLVVDRERGEGRGHHIAMRWRRRSGIEQILPRPTGYILVCEFPFPPCLPLTAAPPPSLSPNLTI